MLVHGNSIAKKKKKIIFLFFCFIFHQTFLKTLSLEWHLLSVAAPDVPLLSIGLIQLVPIRTQSNRECRCPRPRLCTQLAKSSNRVGRRSGVRVLTRNSASSHLFIFPLVLLPLRRVWRTRQQHLLLKMCSIWSLRELLGSKTASDALVPASKAENATKEPWWNQESRDRSNIQHFIFPVRKRHCMLI